LSDTVDMAGLGFVARRFHACAIDHTVYSLTDDVNHPPVIVIHELPGMTVQCIRLAQKLRQAGFTVHLPLLFGIPGDDKPWQAAARLCISREFHLFACDGGSPVVEWLRALCTEVRRECAVPCNVGVVGMCLTGNFAISLMAQPEVGAAVAAEPSLPFGVSARSRSALGVSPSDIATALVRTSQQTGLICLRFSKDKISPSERFEAIQNVFKGQCRAIEIDSAIYNPDGISAKAHAVLTSDFVDRAGHPTEVALRQVITFLHQYSRPPVPS
jgi:dienelactone hydrolase